MPIIYKTGARQYHFIKKGTGFCTVMKVVVIMIYRDDLIYRENKLCSTVWKSAADGSIVIFLELIAKFVSNYTVSLVHFYFNKIELPTYFLHYFYGIP